MAGSEEIFQKAMSTGHSMAWEQQWDKAATSYRNALEEFPENPKALSSLGLALFELHRYDEALLIFQRNVKAAPNDPIALEKVGQLSEQLGNIQEAVQSYLKAAELYIKSQDTTKAFANWVRVTQLDSEHFKARSYLALVHERLGHFQQAASEYLILASMLQRSGKAEKAAEMIGRALRLGPNNPEARQAKAMLRGGKLLPKTAQHEGGTGPLHLSQTKQLVAPKVTDSGLDPVAEARKLCLAQLAEVLFNLSEKADTKPIPKSGMQALVRGSGEVNIKPGDQSVVMLHIGQAIEFQTRAQEAEAADELEKALASGFVNPALSFNLGLLQFTAERWDDALRNLQNTVRYADYALGAHLLIAQIQVKTGHLNEAATDYMEALKIADSLVVLPDQADDIRQLYEPLIGALINQTDTAVLEQLCENIKLLLLRPNWRTEVLQAREQLPQSADGVPPMPLAEILTQAQSSELIKTINQVLSLARAGHLRTAMDEAFESFRYAPAYLPLHTLVGDLLIQDGRTQDAIAKYRVVSEAYHIRGESKQSINLLKRIVQVAPMDMAVRNLLIDRLAERGKVDEAISEYINLADIYYHLTDLDMARKTFAIALHLAQQGGADDSWSLKLMRRMVDIDMQRLDWRQALRIFEQIRTLEPGDASTRKSLIDLNIRLSQPAKSIAELENYLVYLQDSGNRNDVIPFMEDLVAEVPKAGILRRVLAEQYHQVGRIPDAVVQLDVLGDLLLQAGDREAALQNLEMIIAMNPPNVGEYTSQLAKLKASA
jgi:tetratricopeptide (TPR) repeat protein